MNLRDLRYAVAVSETKHFGKAAEQCFVSQPTLSAQIAKLEETLGVQLFERLPREVRITAVGELLIARAAKIIREADDLVTAARQLQNPLAGEFRLGVIPTSGPYLLPHILKPLRENMPELDVLPVEMQSADCLKALDSGAIDGAILALPYSGSERFEQISLFEEAFEALVPMGHPLAEKNAEVSAEAISSSRLLLLDQGHCLRDHALSFCHSPGAAETYRATSLETLRNLVAAGMGVTLLPELAARAVNSEDVISLQISVAPPCRKMVMLYRKTTPKQTAVKKISQLIRELKLPLSNGRMTVF